MPQTQTAVTAEAQISGEIASLLIRQRNENVDQLLQELKAQLATIYASKAQKDLAVCQIGLGLAALGLGDHDEAARMARNAVKIASSNEFVVSNAVSALGNMGHLDEAHELALRAGDRFPGVPSVLSRAHLVFEDTLDFAAAAKTVACRITIGDDSAPREFFERRKAFMEDLAGRARQLEYSKDDLRALATHAAQCIKNKGRKIFWIELRGNRVSCVSLEVYIDADPVTCVELNFDIAEALYDKFGDRIAADLVPISVRSHIGAMTGDSRAELAVHA